MRVFSRAKILFTFMSHESFKTGSQILTMRTFAWGMQTTFSMPSVSVSSSSS